MEGWASKLHLEPCEPYTKLLVSPLDNPVSLFFFLLRVFFCYVSFFCIVVLRAFCFSLENDATHAKHAQACFLCSAFFVGIFEKKNETFLKSVNISRLCTGKREVVCKKHYNLRFFRKTSVFLKKATQRTRSQKKKHAPGRVFFLLRVRSPTPRSLTHSLALGSLAEIAI